MISCKEVYFYIFRAMIASCKEFIGIEVVHVCFVVRIVMEKILEKSVHSSIIAGLVLLKSQLQKIR